MWKDPFFVIILSFLVLGYRSYASSTTSSLSQTNGTAQGTSPVPSPGSGLGLGDGKSVDKPREDVPVNPKGSDVSDKCSTALEACRDGNKLSACLVHSGAGSKEAFLVVQNGGETSLTVKVLYTPANISAKDIALGKQRIEKVNVTTAIVGSSLIVLNAGFGECVIHLLATVLGRHIDWQLPYAMSVNPLPGVYLLFGIALIIGGIWACCRFGKSERRVDGIPYQELEMGKVDAISDNDAETTEGWDDDWDDDWDEIREVKPSGRKAAGNPSAHGMASKSGAAIDRNGWEDNWDDQVLDY